MVVKLGGIKKKAPAKKAPGKKAPAKKTGEATGGAKAVASGGKPSWMQRGKEAHKRFREERAKSKRRQERFQQGMPFFMKDGESAKVTFLDGDLDADGLLDIPMFYQHRAKLNADRYPEDVVCTDDVEPCPLCEQGEPRAYVGVVTVIDHRSIKSKDGTKTYKDGAKLYVLKPQTLATLQPLARKKGGLSRWRVEIDRTGDKSPRVGNVWDFEKRIKEEFLVKKYGKNGKLPILDYEKAVNYVPAKELRQMGFGKGGAPIGEYGDDGEVDDEDMA